MTLADRLRAVLTSPPSQQSSLPRTQPRRVVEPLTDFTDSFDEVFGGRWERQGRSRSFVVERSLAADDRIGGSSVGGFANDLERSLEHASLFMRSAAAAPFLFFDLETTGLSGGAGTYAFLIGCGWFDGGDFVTRQHLLLDFEDEQSMLGAVASELDRAGVLVSFNGKSFDAPVLETRYLLHRLDWCGAGKPHFDVLHPARRFWPSSADEGCSLGTLERKLVGVYRHHDVGGFEIPARYFRFVRSGDASLLGDVLDHNRQDLVSLALITARLLRLVEDGHDAADDPREAFALGTVYASAGWHDRAKDAYRHALDLCAAGSPSDDTQCEVLRALAIVERRSRNFDEAAAYWQQLVDLPGCSGRVAREAATALAVHHEHRRRNLELARSFAVRSMAREAPPSWESAVRHRLDRLDRKMAGVNESPLFPSSS
ncbi:MAG TPA: ribonuclease H-like domain-containing protein [Vicinamibacterales bacterium]|nr:ribonuclease H-like domain-containing protein [Vicinamibacterales bacterium]